MVANKCQSDRDVCDATGRLILHTTTLNDALSRRRHPKPTGVKVHVEL